MKITIIIFIILVSFSVEAQKRTQHVITDSKIKTIVIEGDLMFKINVKALKQKAIIINTKTEGEYNQHIVISRQVRNDSLLIKSAYQPLFISDNDKLSAHKVISIEVELAIPEGLNLYVKSEIASAEISGNFYNLIVELTQGNCKVNSFLGNAKINTINGNIKIESNYTSVKAFSKNGNIKQTPLIAGDNLLKVQSINGDISVTKAKN